MTKGRRNERLADALSLIGRRGFGLVDDERTMTAADEMAVLLERIASVHFEPDEEPITPKLRETK